MSERHAVSWAQAEKDAVAECCQTHNYPAGAQCSGDFQGNEIILNSSLIILLCDLALKIYFFNLVAPFF